jgi:Aconitase X/Family of unknown function (DUF6088)
MELLGGIVDRAPEFGLLTDAGRQAAWMVELRTAALPNPMLLGSAIGLKVVGDVPFIVGLDRFLGTEITDTVRDYLKDMGAASASNGAVGMFYVENLTPDAKDKGRSALKDGYQTYVIDGWGRGSVFVPGDFLDIGSREAVDLALHRLGRKGTIRRLARGVYDFPKEHPVLGLLSPSADAVARAPLLKRESRDG